MRLYEIKSEHVTAALLTFNAEGWSAVAGASSEAPYSTPPASYFHFYSYQATPMRSLIAGRSVVKQWNLRGRSTDEVIRITNEALYSLVEPFRINIQDAKAQYGAIHDFYRLIEGVRGRELRLMLLPDSKMNNPALLVIAAKESL